MSVWLGMCVEMEEWMYGRGNEGGKEEEEGRVKEGKKGISASRALSTQPLVQAQTG